MARWTPDQRATLDSIVDEFLQNYARGRTILAVDGLDGAGKTMFADALAERFDRAGHAVVRASIDGFHLPRAGRYARGTESPEGYYRDSYDYDRFRRFLIEPFKLGGSTGFVTEVFDHRADADVEMRWETTGANATLIVDGIFLQRPELRGLWNYAIWLDVEPELADDRVAARDGVGLRDRHRLGQKLYLAEANPRAAASAIIDNTAPEIPRRVFADSC